MSVICIFYYFSFGILIYLIYFWSAKKTRGFEGGLSEKPCLATWGEGGRKWPDSWLRGFWNPNGNYKTDSNNIPWWKIPFPDNWKSKRPSLDYWLLGREISKEGQVNFWNLITQNDLVLQAWPLQQLFKKVHPGIESSLKFILPKTINVRMSSFGRNV